MVSQHEVYDLVDNAYDYVNENWLTDDIVREIRETMRGYQTAQEVNEVVVPQCGSQLSTTPPYFARSDDLAR